MFRFLLHPIALAVLVTLLIWFSIVVYWQQSMRPVTGGDIGIYLIGLPLAVIAIGFGLRALYRRSKQAAPKSEAATANAAPAASTDEGERAYTMALLALGVACAGGDDAATVFQALKSRALQPAPDGELRNRDGFPVHASRVQDLDTQEIQAALASVDAASHADSVLRALALLKQSLAPVLDLAATVAPNPDKGSRMDPEAPLPRLVVDLLLPAAWEEHSRMSVARYIGSLIDASGWPATVCTLNTIAATEGTAALQRLDAFSLKANRAGSADFYLLASCESTIDENVVSVLESGGLLFGSSNGQGRIPGEAAAAMLMQATRGMTKTSAPLALISRTALAVRGKSADAPGRIGHDTLQDIAQHCLEAAQLQPAELGLAVSDADQRSSRSGECMNTINSLLPELDPADDLIATEQALGRLGAPGALVALGVASGAVGTESKPVLLMAVSHATERAAVVLRPYAEPVEETVPAT